MTVAAEAEVIFGSTSRGDCDAISDRDILIVDDAPAILRTRKSTLQQEGWSVASYTFRKLNALARNGALFIQHLKDEGITLKDSNGRFGRVLQDFKPKNSYAAELFQNSQLAKLASIRPATASGALWAADLLYVAVRNFGVLYLAEKKQYVFSYAQILELLAEYGVLRCGTAHNLLDLRNAKSVYRCGKFIPQKVTSEVLATALEALPIGAFPQVCTPRSPLDIVNVYSDLPASRPAYQRLRNLERCYLALQAIDPSKASTPEFGRLVRWIQNPRAYVNLAGKLDLTMIARMKSSANAYKVQSDSMLFRIASAM